MLQNSDHTLLYTLGCLIEVGIHKTYMIKKTTQSTLIRELCAIFDTITVDSSIMARIMITVVLF